MIIDGAIRLLSRGTLEMDKDGETAARGVVIDEFLEYLLSHPFFDEAPPKSTGREEFGTEVYLRDALMARRDHSTEDLMATVTCAVAYSVVRAFNRFIKPRHEVTRFILSGGGAFNKTLVRRIKQGLPGMVVRTTDKYGIPNEALEAVAFAILGNETICGTPANVPQVTGARQPVLLGKITPTLPIT
jgi:anhydro-N-acetylmuramic acid kinase